MILSSKRVAIACITLAFAAHVGGVMAAMNRPIEVQMEAMAGSQVTALGNSFADMAIGVLEGQEVATEVSHTPVTDTLDMDQPPPEPSERPEPEKMDPVETVKVPETETKPDTTSEPVAVTTATKKVDVTAEPTEITTTLEPSVAVTVSVAHVPTAMQPVEPVTALQPEQETPKEVQEQPQEEVVKPEVMEALKPVTPELEQVTQVVETLKAQEEPETAPLTASVRPNMRTRAFETAHKTTPKPKQKKKSKPAPRGNAKQSGKAGSDDGIKQAKATQKGIKNGKGKEAGNAAASNYPGLVMRKISRVPRPRGRGGRAMVQFSIATNGSLSSVKIGRSSGSADLDRAALRMIRKAAPFPPPPTGARRSFSIRVEGRG